MLFAQQGRFEIEYSCDPRDTFELLESFHPDILLIDRNMPHIDGLELLERLGRLFPDRLKLPVIMLTADRAPETKLTALSLGASDFLHKPFDNAEVILRVSGQLERRRMHLEILNHNEVLEERVRERTQELEEAQLEIVERLSAAAESRDDDTGEHIRRVADLAARMAAQMGLPPKDVTLLRLAMPLHDVGKIGVSDAVLLKPGVLTQTEYAEIKLHTSRGGEILSGSRFPLLQIAETIARYHHERWDGTGYPEGLAGESIPLMARIATVADVYDALTHARSYKPAWTREQAIEEIVRGAGSHFDPQVIKAFIAVESEPLGYLFNV